MNLSEKAYEQIRHEIITCILAPGQQINQSEIAERLNLGITPVREALTRLSHDGLVTSLPRFGYLVSPITLNDLNELFELRLILETAAVHLAVQRADDAQLQEIASQADFTYHYKEIEDHTAFLRRNAEFHCAVAGLTGNRRLVETLTDLLDQLTRVFHLGLNLRDSAEEMRLEHLELVSALAKRDAETSQKVIIEQINRSRQRILEALQSTSTTSGSISLMLEDNNRISRFWRKET